MPSRGGLAMPPEQPGPMTLVGAVPGTPEAERVLHLALADARVRGEWFRRTAAVERVVAEAARVQAREDASAQAAAWVASGHPVEF